MKYDSHLKMISGAIITLLIVLKLNADFAF